MITELPANVLKQIHRYQPVTIDGVSLYPVTADEYDLFNQARPAIEFIQQSLPVAYVSMPLLQAYYSIDIESLVDAQLPSGLFYRALLFLALALHIGVGESADTRIRQFMIRTSQTDIKRLAAITFKLNGEEYYDITPTKFQRWLPILAAQNGITMHSDIENPELLRTEEYLKQKNAPDLDVNVESLVTSIAAFSGVEESTIWDWPILKLQNRQKAYKRAMDYVVCGIGEAQGTTWKHGNPVPSPFFAKVSTDSLAAIPLAEFAGGAAQDAVNQATN